MSEQPPANPIPLGDDQKTGIKVLLEPTREWSVLEYTNDGQEIRIPPATYTSNIAEIAQRINWKKIIGTGQGLDAKSEKAVQIPAVESPILIESLAEDEEDDRIPSPVRCKTPIGRDNGPWGVVAHYLKSSLEEVNCLLDTLTVLQTPYVKALTVASDNQSAVDYTAHNKAFTWITKRKAIAEAATVLNEGLKKRNASSKQMKCQEQDDFFEELKLMRENWRIRKVNKMIMGDLGYRIFGTKYAPHEIFEIYRKSKTTMEQDRREYERKCLENPGQIHTPVSNIQVTVPCDLMRRSLLTIRIMRDHQDNRAFITALNQKNKVDFLKAKPEDAKKLHWKNALYWAQESLIVRDIFNRLFGEAVQMKDRIAIQYDDTLIITLYDCWLLQIQKEFYTFDETPIKEYGDPYLNKAVRKLFMEDLCQRKNKIQSFVSMPLVSIYNPASVNSYSETSKADLDLSKEMIGRKNLCAGLLSVAAHYQLVNTVCDAITSFLLIHPEPILNWKWCKITESHSIINGYFSISGTSDPNKKKPFFIKITDDKIEMHLNNQEVVHCYKYGNNLLRHLRISASHYLINTIAEHSKLWSFQILACNLTHCELDPTYEQKPMLFMSNLSCSWLVVVKIDVVKTLDPEFYVRACNPGDTISNLETIFHQFRKLNYKLMVGSSLLKKCDLLFSMLR